MIWILFEFHLIFILDTHLKPQLPDGRLGVADAAVRLKPAPETRHIVPTAELPRRGHSDGGRQ